MRIDNSTPFLFGYRSTLWKRKLEMTAVVRATFLLNPGGVVTVPEGHALLAQGQLSGDTFHDDDDDLKGECTYPNDLAEFKKNAEVMLRGACYAPEGKPVKELPVKFAIGSWAKILRVVGKRIYTGNTVGAIATDPLSFTSMPMTYANAFGGPEYDVNPIGKGYKTTELPNIEYPADRIQSSKERLRPASFGPINPFWAERMGKFGRKISNPTSLNYPDDFDISFFQSAPFDQQLAGYLIGNEEIVLQNLHPTKQVIATRLPGLRMRVFVTERDGSFREVPMVIDTLFVDMERETVTLTYRGATPVKDRDLTDVAGAWIHSEPTAAPPKPLGYYREIAKDAEIDPYRIRERVPEELHGIAYEVLHNKRITAPVENAPRLSDPVSQLLQSKLGHLLPGEQERIRELMTRVLGQRRPPGMDLLTHIRTTLATVEHSPPPAVAQVPGVVNLEEFRVAQTLRKVRDIVDKLKADAAKKNIRLKGLESVDSILEGAQFGGGRQDRPIAEPAPGVDYSGQDLSGWNFSGANLSGANFAGAILVGANFQGATLRGASFKQAVLQNAQLAGADLSLADLTQANATNVRAENAKFEHAKLHQTTFACAQLSNADFSHANGQFTNFSNANLAHAIAKNATLEKTLLHDAQLSHADFSGSTLKNCHFGACDLTDAKFIDATVTKTSFSGANATRANFTGAKGEGTAFLETSLDEANLSYTNIDRPFFSAAKVAKAKFYGANMPDAQFCRAILDKADMTRSNLAGANFGAAKLTSTQFNESNLFETNFRDAEGRSCTFDGANLTRSTLEKTR